MFTVVYACKSKPKVRMNSIPLKPHTYSVSPSRSHKIAKVMGEFKAGTLKSSSGQRVTDRKQAIAIALSEAKNLSRQEAKTYGIVSFLGKRWGALSSQGKAAVVAGGAAAGAAGIAGGGYVTGRVKGQRLAKNRVAWDIQNPTAMHAPPANLTLSTSRFPGFQAGQKRGVGVGGRRAVKQMSPTDQAEWNKRASILLVAKRLQRRGVPVQLNARYWGPSGQRYFPGE